MSKWGEHERLAGPLWACQAMQSTCSSRQLRSWHNGISQRNWHISEKVSSDVPLRCKVLGSGPASWHPTYAFAQIPVLMMDPAHGLSSATAILKILSMFMCFFISLSFCLSLHSPVFSSGTGRHKLHSWFFQGSGASGRLNRNVGKI